jgi:hypothetical protein
MEPSASTPPVVVGTTSDDVNTAWVLIALSVPELLKRMETVNFFPVWAMASALYELMTTCGRPKTGVFVGVGVSVEVGVGVSVGGGSETTKVAEPPVVSTVTAWEPAAKPAGTTAVSSVSLTKIVASAVPPKETVEGLVKPFPETVIVLSASLTMLPGETKVTSA